VVGGTIKKWPLYGVEALVLILALLFLLPIYFIFSMTLKSKEEMAASLIRLPDKFDLTNYVDVWYKMKFHLVLFNTALITSVTVLLLVILGAMAAYPLARKTENIYFAIYVFFISGIMLPFQLAMVPLYKLVYLLQLVNTYHGAILIYVSINLPFAIFLYTGFIKTTPKELEEAAMIDGCSIFRSFWITVFPILKPVTATIVVLTSLSVWNDFIVPLLFLNEQNRRTITIELYTFVGQYITDWTLLFPGLVLSISPILIFYLFLQKFMIKGVASGAIKG
jgi:raffinose/stachyose/melibiose transport system permease protein